MKRAREGNQRAVLEALWAASAGRCQVEVTHASLAVATGLSVDTVRRALWTLKDSGRIGIRIGGGRSVPNVYDLAPTAS